MNPLNNEQKELLFDYCLGQASEKEKNEAETLISSNQEAAEIHQNLKSSLEPLSIIEPEICPDELAEKAVSRVQSFAASGNQLRELLATEQVKKAPIKIGAWRNWFEMAAVAATILFITGVSIPALEAVRHKSKLQSCQLQMGNVFQGLRHYIDDYDVQTPSVATIAGAPWWKLGDQGKDNHSNTRNVYLLAKGGYVELDTFVCPCCKQKRSEELTLPQIRASKDFRDRTYITYSFQINCRKTANGELHCRKVIMADMNPLFETLPDDFNKEFRLHLNRTLLTLNSINHNRRGQNVLLGDGHIEFLKSRFVGFTEDDIYTLQDTDVYQGCEVPSHENDFFLAP